VAHKGIFQLKSAQDLVSKARHDFERLQSDPSDAYAAFDFFVTIRHIPEWLYPGDPGKVSALFLQNVELRICRHLAEGAKHFEATDPRHKQVTNSSMSLGAWGNSWVAGVWKPGIWGDGLFVELDPKDPDTRSLGGRISALKLAEKALAIVEKSVI
jgi:hypothetical protein